MKIKTASAAAILAIAASSAGPVHAGSLLDTSIEPQVQSLVMEQDDDGLPFWIILLAAAAAAALAAGSASGGT